MIKPEALGSTRGGTTFFSLPLPFQRSSDSNSPDYLSLDDLYWSSDLGEPRPSDSRSCDMPQIHNIHSNYHLSTYVHSYAVSHCLCSLLPLPFPSLPSPLSANLLQFKLNLYQLKENRKIQPKTFMNMVASMLYQHRSDERDGWRSCGVGLAVGRKS